MIAASGLSVRGRLKWAPTYPKSGWVEHSAEAIVGSVGPLVTQALAEAGLGADRIAAIGLTNQRETTAIWDRRTGRATRRPWSGRIAAPLIFARNIAIGGLGFASGRAWYSTLTSRPPRSPGCSRMFPTPGRALRRGSWRRNRGQPVDLASHRGLKHVTDVTNASRTLLMDLRTLRWADDLCDFFAVPRSLLPEILPSSGLFGKTLGLDYLPDGLPILGVVGDQQASLVGQGCLQEGQAKCTYGTGRSCSSTPARTWSPRRAG